MHKDTKKAVLLAGLALLMWSTVATAFKLTLRHATPYQLLFVSVLTAAVVLNGVSFFRKKTITVGKRAVSAALAVGILMPFAYYGVLFIAYNRLPAQSAQIINFTWPVFMAAAAMLLKKEPRDIRRILFLLISLTGAFVVITRGHFTFRGAADLTGSFLALGSALIWTLFWMLQDRIDLPSTLRMGLYFTGAALIMCAGALVGFDVIPLNKEAWFGGIYTGLFEMSLPFLVWQKALKTTHSVAVISNVIYLSPFLSLIYIRTLLQENIHISSLAGLVLITAGLILQMYLRDRTD